MKRLFVISTLFLAMSMILVHSVYAQGPDDIPVIPSACAEKFVKGVDHAILHNAGGETTLAVVESVYEFHDLQWTAWRIFGKGNFDDFKFFALTQECKESGNMEGWWDDTPHYMVEYALQASPPTQSQLDELPPLVPADFDVVVQIITDTISISIQIGPNYEEVRIAGGHNTTRILRETSIWRQRLDWPGDKYGQEIRVITCASKRGGNTPGEVTLYFQVIFSFWDQRMAVFGPFWVPEATSLKMSAFLGYLHGNTISVLVGTWEDYILFFEQYRRTLWIHPG